MHSRQIFHGILKPRDPFILARRHKNTSSISALQAAFRDPSSPFYLEPGTQGPESPDAPPAQPTLSSLAFENQTPVAQSQPDPLLEAREKFRNAGLDPQSYLEQPIVWGDHDAFQHVNNVRYFRFFESARVKWMLSLGEEIGGAERAKAMMNAQGISLILKSMEVQFKRPVTYPDTLLIGYRPLPSPNDHDVAAFQVTASAYSLNQRAFVAHSKEALVWYDYDNLKKADPGERAREVVRGRISHKE